MEARIKNPAVLLPGALEAFQQLAAVPVSAGISETTLQMVELRASQINGCSGWVDIHSRALEHAGGSSERIHLVAAWREAPYFSDAERAALALAEPPREEFANTSSMDTFNLFRDETISDESDPPGFRAQSAQLAPRFGASRLAMTVYDLPPAQAVCPYHFHWGDEEWMIVVSGTPTVRTPDGERTLEAGDVVFFPVGPEGAHRVHNASDKDARVALFSNKHEFGIIEYPDSDKIGVWGRHNESLDHVIRRSPDLDYWDGERS